MKETIAFMTGSFDPITNGHLSIIERVSQLYDKVVIGLFENPNKKYWWTMSERKQLVQQAVQHLSNVEIIDCPHELVMDAAQRIGATVIVKGLRNQTDFVYETTPTIVHYEQAQLETVYLLAEPKYQHISSSLVRELALFNGPYQAYVPSHVAQAIKIKVKEYKDEKK